MAQTDNPRRVGGWLAMLIGCALFLTGCGGSECVSGPLCGDGDGGSDTVTGTISGTVTVGGLGLAGVTVTLSSGATASTGASGG